MPKTLGLLDRVLATNCPPFRTMDWIWGHINSLAIRQPSTVRPIFACLGAPFSTRSCLMPRPEAGAEVREGFSVTGLTTSDGQVTGIRGHGRSGAEVEEQARIVIGADGRNSLVAKAVGAKEYNARPVLTCGYYAYWDVLPHTPATHPLPHRVVISFPTNEGLTVTYFACRREQFATIRSDLEQHWTSAVESVAAFKDLFREARRVERIRGTGDLPNFFRKAHGDGWALVGDAGYHKDPIIAQGISDAFRSAEWLADAVHTGFSGARPLTDALGEYQRVRDEHFAPMYELSCSLATLEPPSTELLALYEALRTNPIERNRFFGTLGGAASPSEYYAPENLQRIVAAAAA